MPRARTTMLSRGSSSSEGTEAARYGYTPTYDANGLVQSVAVDPNNPYSKANLLTQSYKEGQTANRNSFAGRGQLYAGSLNAAQGRATQGYNIGSNNLQNSFIDFIANNQQALGNAANNYNTTVGGEYGNALGRYVPPEAPQAAPAPAPPAPAQGFTLDPAASYNSFPTSRRQGRVARLSA